MDDSLAADKVPVILMCLLLCCLKSPNLTWLLEILSGWALICTLICDWAALWSPIRAPMCSPFSAQAPNRGIMGFASRSWSPGTEGSPAAGNRMLVCGWSQIWLKLPGIQKEFGEARKKRFSFLPEFLMVREPAIFGFSAAQVGDHSKTKKWDWWLFAWILGK